jgi:cytosine/adenosine deaminase-related metal-dependent hydrolase
VHANFLAADEYRAAADAGASIVITPVAEMQMGLGLPPTGAARAAGVRVGLGSDVVSAAGADMFTQMRFLLQTHRALANKVFHDRETMPPRLDLTAEDALRMATIESARCHGLDGRIGSLTPGKQADVILLRRSDLNLAAARDPIAATVLHASVANVDTVIVAGELLKRDGRLLHYDLSRRLGELAASSDRINGKLATQSAPTP